jgi:hypothetical protein
MYHRQTDGIIFISYFVVASTAASGGHSSDCDYLLQEQTGTVPEHFSENSQVTLSQYWHIRS